MNDLFIVIILVAGGYAFFAWKKQGNKKNAKMAGLIALAAFVGFGITHEPEEDEVEETEEVAEAEEEIEEETVETEEEAESNPDVLSEEDVATIENNLHVVAEREVEREGVEINIHSFEYDEEDHEIVAWVDLQARPDSEDDAQSWARFFTHNMAEATVLDSENYTYDVSTLLVTQIEDDGFIHWTTSNFYRDSERYAFYDAQGMDLLD